jgi:hypothetical protein
MLLGANRANQSISGGRISGRTKIGTGMYSSDEHSIEPDGRALNLAFEHPLYLNIRFGRLSCADFHENGGRAICLQKSDFKVSLFERHDVTVSFGLLPQSKRIAAQFANDSASMLGP